MPKQPKISLYTPNLYELQNSILTLDSRGFCTFEKHTNFVYNPMTFNMNNIPNYSHQFKQDLFHIYFEHVHPFFPVLNRLYVLQSSEALPLSLQWSIMAIALHFTDNQYQNTHMLAATFHNHASLQLDTTPDLLTIQTLLLLYKYQEIITPVGTSLPTIALEYLKQAQTMLPEEQGSPWTTTDEFLCRANWILFITVSLNNTTDERWRDLQCAAPCRPPTISDTEQCDINITYNLIHLIDITLLFSQTLGFVQEKSTLFNAGHPEFAELASNLNVWKSTLPSHIALSLSADPPNLYSAQNHGHDNSKTTSFISYLCLVYDIVDLVISLHQPALVDISKKALCVSYRAHSLTIGDMHSSGYSRLACIQGSRIVCYGLTLAIQAQAHYLRKKQDKCTFEDSKRLHSICSLSFQILSDVMLSPELYMTVQSLYKKIIKKDDATPKKDTFACIQENRSLSQDYVYTTSTQDKPLEQQSSPQQDQQQQPFYLYNPEEDRTWQNYTYQWCPSYYEANNMPITPTLTQEFHPSVTHPSFTPEPITPPTMNMDSYFQPLTSLHHTTESTVAIASPGFSVVSLLPIQNSKSCKNHQLL